MLNHLWDVVSWYVFFSTALIDCLNFFIECSLKGWSESLKSLKLRCIYVMVNSTPSTNIHWNLNFPRYFILQCADRRENYFPSVARRLFENRIGEIAALRHALGCRSHERNTRSYCSRTIRWIGNRYIPIIAILTIISLLY